MALRHFYHFMQIVHDFDDASDRYDRLLAPQVFIPKHWSDFDLRWASLGVIGPELVFELMEPSTKPEHLDAPLPKFGARHGEHMHSFAWYDDDLPGLRARLTAQGIRVVDPYPEMPGIPKTIFTHPKDTVGQLEFQEVTLDRPDLDPRVRDHFSPHLSSDWTGEWWRDSHPAGIERLSHLTLQVADMAGARRVFADVLGGRVFHEEQAPDRDSVFVLMGEAEPGREIVVELARPTDPSSRLAQDLAAHGEMPHAMTFRVRDLEAAEKHVADCGMALLDDRTDSTITVDPADLHNGVVSFTTRSLPNDPRR